MCAGGKGGATNATPAANFKLEDVDCEEFQKHQSGLFLNTQHDLRGSKSNSANGGQQNHSEYALG